MLFSWPLNGDQGWLPFCQIVTVKPFLTWSMMLWMPRSKDLGENSLIPMPFHHTLEKV